MKVEEQSQLFAAEAQVRNYLRLVYMQELLDCLDLHDDRSFYDQVDSVRKVNRFATVNNWQQYFRLHL